MKDLMTRYAVLLQQDLLNAGSKEQFIIIYTDRGRMPKGEMRLRCVAYNMTEEGMYQMAADYAKATK
jgi:hypothetical protein